MTNIDNYLESTGIIDWDKPEIIALAQQCAVGTESKYDIARNCFDWVRDNIKHSGEHKLNPITCKASDVLKFKTGFCFAKSHLLAALLRANTIPAGLCYQRLSMDGVGAPFCLHGLNAVFLEGLVEPETLDSEKTKAYWYRVDCRGNNQTINAQFCPPIEQLAFPIHLNEEVDYFEVCAEPLAEVISVLEASQTYQEVIESLPTTNMIKPISALTVRAIQ